MTPTSFRSAGRRRALSTGAVLTALALLAACERPSGQASAPDRTARAMPLPPNMKFAMQTAEFDAEVATNEMGFRGGPVAPASPERTRIVVLGDDYTFGQGVGGSETWPARLEARLRAKGVAAEVLNLGSPGAGPNEYADIAEHALPLLKPQVVVVGLVQGEDLLQAGEPGASVRATPGGAQPLRERAEAEFAAFRAQERDRFAALEPKVRTMFESGGVDPALVALGVRRPGFFLEPVEKSAAELEPNRKAMLEALRRVQTAADAVSARTIAIGVPHPFYVSGSAQSFLRQLGFHANRSGLDSFQPNGLARDAVLAAGFDAERMRGPISAFRRHSGRPRTPRLYFHWDNHLNAKGHEELARLVARVVRRQIVAGKKS